MESFRVIECRTISTVARHPRTIEPCMSAVTRLTSVPQLDVHAVHVGVARDVLIWQVMWHNFGLPRDVGKTYLILSSMPYSFIPPSVEERHSFCKMKVDCKEARYPQTVLFTVAIYAESVLYPPLFDETSSMYCVYCCRTS